MPSFGSNGAVLRETNEATTRDYGTAAPTKIKRVLLGVFLCGIAASLLVALIAGIALFGITITTEIAGSTTYGMSSGDGFLAGAFLSLAFCSLNWFVFYIVVPVTWILLAFSIGRFPRRGIGRPAAYVRWSAIWGAALAGGVSSLFTLNISLTAWLGALITGGSVGALAGIICGWLFIAIVRPARQLADSTADVF
ncbi:hypothetical protein D1224_00225 [Henriciella barbarensis]|uniref:Uncharacterized protein n=1 Tax=Henriciella barbarensis TaxID=86342 RepID=A0A399R4Y2_9PROT|nr:hypothetical protein [Henriciella barbarensis]RIJ26340.1 hypothetical protein D1224_00225 [Henriciella barbarensis]